MEEPRIIGAGSINWEDKGARYHIVYVASLVGVRVRDLLKGEVVPIKYAIISPRVTIIGVNSLFWVVRINGVIGVIKIQLTRLPPMMAAKQRFNAGVERLFVSFSTLTRGVQKFGLIRLATVIRIEYTAVRSVARKINITIRRL